MSQAFSSKLKSARWHRLGLLLMGFLILMGIFGWRLFSVPQILVGSYATETIFAPRDAMIVDEDATLLARANAREQGIQVFQVLEDRNERVLFRLESLLSEGDGLFERLGPFPYTQTAWLSSGQQRAFLNLPDTEWLQFQQTQVLPNPELAQALQRFSKGRSPEQIGQVITAIDLARKRQAQAQRFLESIPGIYSPALALTGQQWQRVRSTSTRITRQILGLGVMPGLPEELRRRGINTLIGTDSTYAERQLITELVLSVLEPNLKIDRFASMMARENEAQSVRLETIPIRQGQLLIQKGQLVTPRIFNILDQLNLTQRGVDLGGLLTLGALVSLTLILWQAGLRLLKMQPEIKDIAVVGVLATAVALAGMLLPKEGTMFIPLALLGLLVGHYYGSKVGILAVLSLAPMLVYGWGQIHPIEALVPILIGGVVAAVFANPVRSRAQIALVGVGVALIQGLSYVSSMLWLEGLSGWQGYLLTSLFYALGGLAWSIVALGLSPYLEGLFDVVTPIRLAELSNPNCGLLKRLVTEAPGTYQHTQFVANLATAAAQALGDNADLVRVGCLYHDIGKMKRAQYFIENQMGLPNPHDQIDDPWRSAQIIRDHVADGLKLAQQYNLPKVIRAFIPEHQGTILIAYFYHQARQGGEQPVAEADFRYSGPIPQSRETGIVMLADACEAALRSFNNNPRGMDPLTTVRRILQARWDEGQLIDSGLREEELDLVACTFIKIWRETNHKRIRYPNQAGGVELRRRSLASKNS